MDKVQSRLHSAQSYFINSDQYTQYSLTKGGSIFFRGGCMTREEKINRIIELLEKHGLIPPDLPGIQEDDPDELQA